jgi:GTP:adenosylcobinamide-phosphate guanylyltransferase
LADRKDGFSIPLDAVVLAGGINTRELYPGYKPGYKALVEIAGRPLISYVLDALNGSPSIGRIGIVGSEGHLRPTVGSEYAITPSGDSLMGSILAALSVFPDSPMIALVTGDLPMLRSDMIDQFVELCSRLHGDYSDNLFLSVVSEEHFTGAFAACAKNLNKFRDTAICHGNLILISPSIARNEKAMSRINGLYAERKNPISSALAVGLGMGLAYVFGVHIFHALSLRRMAAIASNNFSMGFVPVPFPYPEVAVDVDEPSDYQIAQSVLSRG